MAELSAPGRNAESAENLLFSAARRDHRPRPRAMIRIALAAFLAALLAQVAFGAAFEQIAQASASAGGFGAFALGEHAPSSATAEALARAAPVSSAPAQVLKAITDLPPAGPAVVPVPSLAEVSACPKEMVLVEGEYCTEVAQICVRWLDDETLPFARCGSTTRRRVVSAAAYTSASASTAMSTRRPARLCRSTTKVSRARARCAAA